MDKRGKRDTILIPDLALDVQIHGGKERPLNSTLTVKLRHVKLPQLDVTFEEVTGD